MISQNSCTWVMNIIHLNYIYFLWWIAFWWWWWWWRALSWISHRCSGLRSGDCDGKFIVIIPMKPSIHLLAVISFLLSYIGHKCSRSFFFYDQIFCLFYCSKRTGKQQPQVTVVLAGSGYHWMSINHQCLRWPKVIRQLAITVGEVMAKQWHSQLWLVRHSRS